MIRISLCTLVVVVGSGMRCYRRVSGIVQVEGLVCFIKYYFTGLYRTDYSLESYVATIATAPSLRF